MSKPATVCLTFIVFVIVDLWAVNALSVTLTDAYAVLGQPFWWTCVVDKDGSKTALSYHWRYQDADIVGGDKDGMVIVLDNGVLYFKNVTEENIGYYTCVVSESQTASESGAFLKKAFVSRTISTTTPVNQSIQLGDSVTFHCVVDAKPEALVTWSHNDEEIDANDNIHVIMNKSGEGHFTLELMAVTYDQVGEYICIAEHDLLFQPIFSDAMRLEVFGPPVIFDDVKAVTSPVGYNISLPCRAHSNPKATVTWSISLFSIGMNSSSSSSSSLSPSSKSPSSTQILSKENSPLHISQSIVSLNKDGDLILITNASEESSGIYSCKWSNEFGSVELNATITVGGPPQPPEFTNTPKSQQDIVEKSELRLHCAGTGNRPVRVSWIFPNGSEKGNNKDEYSLVIKDVKRADAGVYTCVIRNSEGTKKTNVTVNVLFAPYFITGPIDTTVKASSGLNITCTADGNPKPTMTWKLPWTNREITASSNSSINYASFQNSNIIIHDTNSTHLGWYICTATNIVRKISILAHIKVLSAPTIVKPLTSVGTTEGDEVLLKCEVKSYQSPQVDWFRKYMPDLSIQAFNTQKTLAIVSEKYFNETDADFIKLDSNTSTEYTTYTEVNYDYYMFYLQIQDIKEGDAGIYLCKVSNDEGSIHTFGAVRVITFPTFLTAPSGGKVLPGEDVMLHCHSTGIPVPSQRWLLNGGKLISNPRFVVYSNGSLSISNVTENEMGTYTCLSTNQAGQRSSIAELVISSKPRLINAPKNQTLPEFEEGALICEGYSDLSYSVAWYNVDKDGNRIDLLGEKRINNSNEEHSGEYGYMPTTNDELSKSNMYISEKGNLIFKCLEKIQEAWYVCELKNEDGATESEPVFVRVETLPDEISLTAPDPVAKEGDIIELRCSVNDSSSSLNGSISWMTPTFVEITKSGHEYYPEVILDDMKTSMGYLSTLKITGVNNARHGGYWWCKTCNIAGCITSKTILNLQGRPVVRDISSAVNETQVTISCLTYGDPQPEVIFLYNGTKIANDTKGHTIANNLLIIDIDEIKAEYLCEISNLYGLDSKTFGVPPHPTIVHVISEQNILYVNVFTKIIFSHVNFNKLIIDYKKSDSSNAWDFQTYEISSDMMNYFNVFDDIQEGKFNKSCGDDVNVTERRINNPELRTDLDELKIFIESTGDFFLYSFQSAIKNLNAYSSYSIRAKLENVHGSSLASEIVNVTTLPSAPSDVTNIKSSVESSSCTLSWDNPINLNGKAEEIAIDIQVSHKIMNHIVYSKSVPVTSEPIAVFSGLSLGEYIATIAAFNTELNVSSESAYVQFHIQDQAPDFIPEVLEIKSVTHAAMTVFWKIPENPNATIPSVTGYVLLLKSLDAKSNSRRIQIDNGHTSNTTITKLREHEEHSIQIASTNQAGVSPYSQPKRFTTRFAAFSEMALGSTDIDGYSISWTLIAIIIIAVGAALVFFTGFLVFSYQWRLARRGSVNITPEHTANDVKNDDKQQERETVHNNNNVVADQYRDSDFILY